MESVPPLVHDRTQLFAASGSGLKGCWRMSCFSSPMSVSLLPHQAGYSTYDDNVCVDWALSFICSVIQVISIAASKLKGEETQLSPIYTSSAFLAPSVQHGFCFRNLTAQVRPLSNLAIPLGKQMHFFWDRREHSAQTLGFHWLRILWKD